MGKVHKSLRVDEATAARVSALGADGETEAATYNRVLAAGVDALERGEPSGDGQGAELVAALRAHIDTLKAANDELSGQMAVKDEQIHALSVLTAQAQQATAKALESPQADESGGDDEGKRRGIWARLFG